MSSVEDKLAKSLTAESIELIPYLPYLLQDLWELGSSPKDILSMISKQIQVSDKTKVLDLACGKGAVSINLAKALGCNVKGIDIITEFIDFANKKAREFGVENLCEFNVGDINESVKVEKNYDIVIFGAVGNVLGDQEETILKLKSTVKDGGYIFIDDAYGKEDSNPQFLTREQWLMIFQNTGVKLLEEKLVDDDELVSINNEQMACIEKRVNELKKTHPEKESLFDSYLQSQQAECAELEDEISGVTMLLQVV
ncbi:MAG: class I SAM-dependent methyltransferase [Firmicutes bacterium]|nr:class I SAM-dependent methyltransferase [Bacillota bacterium]